MRNKRKLNIGTTDFIGDQDLSSRQYAGFWLLVKITETIYMNAIQLKTVIRQFKPPLTALIEPAFSSITWHPGEANEISFPFDQQGKRLLTNELFGGCSIRANAQHTNTKMVWRFVVNHSSEHYSQFCYEFKRDVD
jgi:hypothetical protein